MYTTIGIYTRLTYIQYRVLLWITLFQMYYMFSFNQEPRQIAINACIFFLQYMNSGTLIVALTILMVTVTLSVGQSGYVNEVEIFDTIDGETAGQNYCASHKNTIPFHSTIAPHHAQYISTHFQFE